VTPGVLFVCAVADGPRRAQFDHWYDTEHLPGRMQVPGFRGAVRYREVSEAAVRATACLYDLESVEVLRSEAYLALQTRTAQDTAAHVGEVDLHRLVGELGAETHGQNSGDNGIGDQAFAGRSPMVVAAIEPTRPAGVGPPLSSLATRRYPTEWRGRRCDLVLRAVPDGLIDSTPPDRSALKWWLLRQVSSWGSDGQQRGGG
jgi:hypothetical protein